jgi:uroporphyrinogen decarboxylase
VTASPTSRERVLAALHHQEPDRVPSALWGSYYTLQDLTYFNLLRHLDLGEPVRPFRRFLTKNCNYLDDRALDRLGTDVRYVWLGFTDLGGARADTLVDAWGVRHQRIGSSVYAVGHPLAEASAEQIDAYPWPRPEQSVSVEQLRERLAVLGRDGRHAIAARAVASYGPFEQACEMRGREQFLMDLILDPPLAQLLVGKITDVLVQLMCILLDTAGNELDIIEIPGDDFAGQESLLISPKIFHDLFKPAMRRIIAPIKQFRPDLVVAFHSDGAIGDLLPAFVELGIDLLHPLEPVPANDLAAIKAQYGQQLSFMGAVDIKKAMIGSLAELETEVKARLEVLAPGGGYILAPANHLQPDVSPENIVGLFELGRKYGSYPLP